MKRDITKKLREKDHFYNVWSALVEKFGSGEGSEMNHTAIEILNALYGAHYKGRVPANMIVEYDLVDLVL